jgi:ectoine hydroxylase-related dioxygenase (phytanoyl-CoA dioxygenase family)
MGFMSDHRATSVPTLYDAVLLLDATQREFFAEHGWLVVRAAVARARVAELEAAVDAVYGAYPSAPSGHVWEVAGVSRMSAMISQHAHDPAIAERVAGAFGCARIKLLQDTVLVKPALVGGEVAWHQDHTYTGYLDPARVASVRLALTDCNAGNGCLEVIDASHKWGLVGDVRALTETHVADALGERAAQWRDHVIALELEPGDLSIHHCLTLHRSGKNTSAQTRKTLITRLFDADCKLVAARLPPGAEAYFPVDADARLADSAFPVLYQSNTTVLPL